jgi:hypothetical protein
MKHRMLSVPVLGALFIALSGAMGCGGSNTSLTISPVGPTVVEKGQTLQFTANQDDVTWSVEGGSGNGSIDSGGLYTPPTTLPAGNPEVTVLAATDDDTASAIVSLRTADTIQLSAQFPVSQATPANGIDFGMGFMGNRMAVGLGSVQEFAVFTSENAAVPNLFLTEALDLGNYQTADNISEDPLVIEYSAGVEVDSELNPYVLFGRGLYGDGVRLMLTRSADQGQTFGEPVPLLDDANLDNDQIMAAMAIDANETLHVAFSRINSTDSTAAILYMRSADGGQTWSAPSTVESGDELIFPSLAVSPDGTSVYVAFFDGTIPNTVFSRSTDSGASFSNPIEIGAVAPTNPNPFPFPDVALDPDGNVYVALSQDPDDNGQYDAVIRKSDNGGSSFGAAVSVGPAGGDSQLFLNIAIDDLGRIDAVWSSGLLDMSLVLADVNYARSTDGGASFGETQPLLDGDTGLAITRALRHDKSGRLYVHYLLVDDASLGDGELVGHRGE